MRKLFLFILVSPSIFQYGFSKNLIGLKNQSQCIGPKQPLKTLIYLHGMDDFDKSNSANRKALQAVQALAEAKSLRVYAPQAEGNCLHLGHVQRCWKNPDRGPDHKFLLSLLSEAEVCLEKKKVDYVLGFSNGGWFAIRAYLACAAELQNVSFIGVAAAGHVGPQAGNPKYCSKLHLVVGQKDKLTLPSAEKFKLELQKKGFSVELDKPNGGHELLKDSLLKFF